jgi:hypothetical protein
MPCLLLNAQAEYYLRSLAQIPCQIEIDHIFVMFEVTLTKAWLT